LPQARDAAVTAAAQEATQRRDIGYLAPAHKALHHRVISVEAALSKTAEPQQEMDDQQQRRLPRSVGVAGVSVSEASAQSLLEAQLSEQGLEDHQAGEGGELLVLEAKAGQSEGVASDVRFAKLHAGDFLGLLRFFSTLILAREVAHFLFKISSKSSVARSHPWWNPATWKEALLSPVLSGVYGKYRRLFMQLAGLR
jgi:hypothetical protein